MNSRAQIGQLITSLLVLIALFFLMVIFVVGSSAIGTLIEPQTLKTEEAFLSTDSGIATHIFLHDFLYIEDEEISVVSAIHELSSASDARLTILLSALEERFDNYYSCNQSNELIIHSFQEYDYADELHRVYIQYPETPVSQSRRGSVTRFSEDYFNEYATLTVGSLQVSVMVNTTC